MSAAVKKAAEFTLKLARQALTNPDEFKIRIKKIVIVIACLISILIIIPATVISLPGVMIKAFFSMDNIEGTDQNEEFMSIENSEIYKKIREIYFDYNNAIDEKINKSIERIKKENAYTIKVEKKTAKGTKIVEETKYPEIIKNVDWTKPKIQYILAYIATKHIDAVTDSGYKFNRKEIQIFLEEITDFKENISGTDPIYYTASTNVLTEKEIAAKFFTAELYPTDYIDKQEQFLTSYDSLLDLDDELIDDSYDNVDLDTLTYHEIGMKIPHYLQYDKKWGSNSYGTGTISKSGCGPTSFAMVVSYLNNTFISPATVASWSESHGYYVPGAGTSWGLYEGASKNWNISCSNIGKNADLIIKSLSEGNPIIASMGPGTFTKAGHFIVLRGINKDRRILVNDPNDNYYTKNFYNKSFDLSLIMNEAKNFWVFSK